jgi:hypothetical protein
VLSTINGDFADFVTGAGLLLIAMAAYAHIIWTLRELHRSTDSRLERLEQLLKKANGVDTKEMEQRIDTIREAGAILDRNGH